MAETQTTTLTLAPTVSSAPDFDVLSALFDEIHDLTLRLRSVAGAPTRLEQASVAARNVLKSLQPSGPLTVPQIARLRSTSRQNIQVLANRLQKEGCVEFVPNPSHHRSSLVQLTESGRQVLGSLETEERKVMEPVWLGIASGEAAMALKVLRRITELLGRNPGLSPATPGEKKEVSEPGSKRLPRKRGPVPSRKQHSGFQEDSINGATDLPVSLL